MTLPASAPQPPADGHAQFWHFYAVERSVGKKWTLVAVLPAPAPEWAITAVGELFPAHFPPEELPHGLRARQVACPGVANPMAEDGWVHYDGPTLARCPRCQRAQGHAEPGYRRSVRLVGMPSRRHDAPEGHDRHNCRKCKAELEYVTTAVGSPLPPHPAKGR